MKWTAKQKEILSIKKLCDVIYSDMWKAKRVLGYSYKGLRHYGVRVARDLPKESRAAVLIHEVSHAYLGHLDNVDQKKELQDIKAIFDELNLPFSAIRVYGGPMSFLNICMDLEINSKILTLKNVNDLCRIASICTPEVYGVPTLDNFRDYYRPMIERLQGNGNGNSNALSQGDKISSSNSRQGSSGSNSSDSGDPSDSSKTPGNSEKLPSSDRDLADKVDPFDTDLDEEIRDELLRESYTSGNERELNQDPDAEDEVYTSEEAGSLEEDENCDNPEVRKGYGSVHAQKGYILGGYKDPNEKAIQKFLSSIIKHDILYYADSMKHYNRNTRRSSDGILYTSRRRKVNKNRQKLAILLDVSGSMKIKPVLAAFNTFKNSASLMAGGSKLVAWDTRKVGEYSVDDIPKEITLGNGTDIAAGLRYLNSQGYEDIIIYSDFVTSYEPLLKAAEACTANLYSICAPGTKKTFDDYFELNKAVLWL